MPFLINKYQNDLYKPLINFDVILGLIVDLVTLTPLMFFGNLITSLLWS